MTTILILVAGIVAAAVVYVAMEGHVVFLPILLVLPPVVFWRRRL